MTLGIMQPYFLPYLGYFQLINKVDTFILLDEVQFIRHGWIERNRVLNSNEGWQYIKVPLIGHSRDTLIKNILIRNSEDWQSKLFAQLVCYKRKAPFYKEVIQFLIEALRTNFDAIAKLNKHLLIEICKYLDTDTEIIVFSEMDCNLENIKYPGDWALEISKSIGADTYINPIDGKSLFDKNKFTNENIDLKFMEPELKMYNQNSNTFESGLSVIDAMMFCEKDEIKYMLAQGKIVT